MSEFAQLVNLASERLGARAIQVNDEFFGAKENLLKDARPVFIEGKVTPRGIWVDGWETRRRRNPGNDWCIVRLGLRGKLRGVVVDTSYFKGNFPERCSIEACDLGEGPPYPGEKKKLKAARTRWIELLPESQLDGDKPNFFSISHEGCFTHVRLRIYPDGGVARLRVYGEVVPARNLASRAEFDLAAIENGGDVIAASDDFFGGARNLLMPGPALNAMDGWQTRRRRGPGHDWAIVKLGLPGVIRRIEVDTSYFPGNSPEGCSLDVCYNQGPSDAAISPNAWKQLLPAAKLKLGNLHVFRAQLRSAGPATHVRFNIYPDGGVARLRILGRAERPADRLRGVELFNHLTPAQARTALLDCCGSKKWAERMLELRPFASADQAFEAAERVWTELDRKDRQEAFRQYPAFGATAKKSKFTPRARRWFADEQSAFRKASADTLAILAAANRAYEASFGRQFVISLAGRTAEEILARLQERLSNDAEAELLVSAEEQCKITRLRLERLLIG
jgi:allantoicase